MRGADVQQSAMFSYLSAEQRVPQDHPLRPIREFTDTVLRRLSPNFAEMYSQLGRPSIPPEKLLRALLLQVFYTIRSERMLMEQLQYNLLFRWFVGLNLDDEVWVPTVFSKNRDRLLRADIARLFFAEVLEQAKSFDLTSDEHFTVDGTLLEAWASLKSFKKVDGDGLQPSPDDPGNPSVDFHGEKRSNETHCSTTDSDALLARKGNGKEAKLSYSGHVLMENRNGLVVDSQVLQANGTAERDAALLMAEALPGNQQVTLGADKNYDTAGFVADVPTLNVTPHVAQNNKNRRERHRRPHDTPCRIRDQPAQAQAGRRDLRMAEDRGRDAEAQAPRPGIGRLDVHVRDGGVQPRQDQKPGGSDWLKGRPGSSVPGRPEREQ